MIGQKGIPASFGGIEKHVEELAVRLVKHGHEVTVFCRPYYTEQGIKSGLVKRCNGKYIYKGVRLGLLPSINTKHLDTITHSVVSTYATLFAKFDIVHYHALGPGLVSFLPWFFSKAVVSTVHGLDWQRAKWRKVAVWALKLGELFIVYFSKRRIVVSKTLKNYFQQKHGIDCDYIPNGLSHTFSLKPDKISKKYDLKGKDYILFVGRLVPEKGCHYLIEAFSGLNTSKKLVIVGGTSHSGNYQNKLHEMAKENSNIIFTGYLYGDELKELYSNCYLFVLPSELEGLPVVLLEALGFGCPVLVSDIAENMEVIAPDKETSYGFAFKSRDIKDLQQKLEKLLKNSQLLDTLREEVISYVLSNYNWDTITMNTIKVYEKVLSR